ncbi:catabolite repression HPr-like protein [Pelagirhabdus alkalitolerans]|uniref:Catabolite repression HPr-like protein n=1 Tax=Pelagirhabdus alkalitolerans TaxID=1612202 RepID=A0A1G6ND70_9BACI|nr:HPr family phosphocarrier protein [Pelagirhabdus alkalitolerans]SDC65748.1 catabolite repression HPr-like protein [Pelagirhabdus alkalitolerans]
MVEKSVVVNVEPGLQSGPASEFVQTANQYAAEVFLEKGNRRINAKSIMGLLSLAVAKGDEVTLLSDGGDAEEAVDALTEFLSKEE